MSEHSPAPWGVTHEDFSYIVVDSGKEEFAKVCEVVCYPHEREKANAYLIAAAPELLHALEQLQTMFYKNLLHEPCPDEVAVLDAVDSAIAKAEGEST